MDTLIEKVAPEVITDLKNAASDIVYESYEPKKYKRRWTLLQDSNYKVEKTGETEITITPIAEFNRAYGGWNEGDELAGLLNYGNYCHGHVMNYSAPLPRPFLDKVTSEWNDKKLYKYIADALTKAGIPAEVITSTTVTK